MRLIGAGLGRTGTLSLKLALEQLLGGRCYHMMEVFAHQDHVASWTRAARGAVPDWHALFDGYRAVVDWPAASFYRELMDVFPDALVLLSLRDAQSWWRSASATIFPSTRKAPPEFREMIDAIWSSRFTTALDDRDACIAAYERHNAEVRRVVPASRLVAWTPSDGWAPLCHALALPVPQQPFPHANSTEEFLGRIAQAESANR